MRILRSAYFISKKKVLKEKDLSTPDKSRRRQRHFYKKVNKDSKLQGKDRVK